MKSTKGLHLAFRSESRDNEKGITIIEIVISMAIIGLLTLAVAPLLLTGLQTTSVASTSTASTTRVQQTIETLRIAPVTCSSLNANARTTTYNDGRGNNFTVAVRLPSGCTSGAEGQAVPVVIEARRTRGNLLLNKLTTKIFVPGTASVS